MPTPPPSAPPSSPGRLPVRAWAALLLCLLALAACTTTTTMQVVDSEAVTGRSVLYLNVPNEDALPQELHEHTQQAVEQALSTSPYVGRLMTEQEARGSDKLSLELRHGLDLFSDTFVQTGVVDPQLAKRLGRALDVDLLSSTQLLYLPCPSCEEGSRLWLVGQVAEASSGRVLMRTHLRVGVDDTPEALAGPAKDLLQDYLATLDALFRPKWHKLRFRNLGRSAG